ncbi:MAG TPA: DUF6297 family protein [Arachnia sp.]|nr:DUF6297 family protein [Arachnia sp.]
MRNAEWTADDLRAWLRAHRRRPRRSWSDWYALAFAAVVLLPMIVSLAGELRLPLLTCEAGATCVAATGVLPFTWIAASFLAVAAVSSLLGPIATTAATASWVLATPLDRGDLLSPGLSRIVVVGVGIGLLSGVLLWVLAGGSPLWIAACTSTAVLAVLSAALAQQGGGWHTLRAAVAIAAASWTMLGALSLTQVVGPVLVAAVTTACAAFLAWRVAARVKVGLAGMSRFSLARHSQTRAGLAGAAAGADAGLVLDIAALNLGGTRSSRALTTTRSGWPALAGYEVRRLARRSPQLLWGLPATIVAAAFIPIHPTFGLATACVVLVPALGLMLSSLRAVLRSRGLARALGLGRGAQVQALTVGAALAAATWIVACGLLLVVSGLPLLTASLLAWAVGASGLAGALRWVSSSSPDFSGGIVMTDAGPVPVSALLSATAGFDVALVTAGLLLIGTPPVLCAALACLALAWSFIRVSRPTRI